MQDESSPFVVICLRAATCDKVGNVSKLSFLGMVKASNPFLNFGRGQWGSTTEMKRDRDEAVAVSVVEPIDSRGGVTIFRKLSLSRSQCSYMFVA